MGSNTTTATLPVAVDDVMASVDDDGTTKRFVVADISRDNSWISLPLAEAATLSNWR